MKSKQKHPRCKKRSGHELKRPCRKRFEIKMGDQGLLLLIGFKILIIMTSLQNIVISGDQGLLMLMGSKFLIKMTRSQNIKVTGYPLNNFVGAKSL